jgi:hypothetical protein
VRRRNRKRWKKAPLARTKEEKCATKWCRNRKAEKTTRYTSASGKVIVYTGFLNHCWKCRARMLKERRPWTYVLNMLRHSARKRNLPFTLTIKEFKEWCLQTGYLERRGNKPTDLTIDRIDWNDGYHIHNIQVLTHEENSEQGADNTPRTERVNGEPDPDNEPF